MLAVNKIINKIKDNHYNIEYQPLGDKIKIVLFPDAAFANHEDGGSQGGHLVFLVDENSKFNLISWQSKRIKRAVCSSLAAETLALSDGVDHAIYLSVLFKELYPKFKTTDIAIEIFTNNKLLHDAIHSEKIVTEKPLLIDIRELKELINHNRVINILWTKSEK